MKTSKVCLPRGTRVMPHRVHTSLLLISNKFILTQPRARWPLLITFLEGNFIHFVHKTILKALVCATTQMKLGDILLSEKNQSHKDKYYVFESTQGS